MIKDFAYVGYPTKDMKKARAFYEGILELKPTDEFGPVTDESSYIEYAVGQSTLALGNMDGWTPSHDGPCVTFEVDDVKELFEKLKAAGYEIKMEIMDFPGCSMGMVRDADGNQVALHQKK